MKKRAMKNVGYARKRDANEPGIIAALEEAGATVVALDKPIDLLVGFGSDTDLLEVKNGNQPPSWRRITDDQAEFFKKWKGKRAAVVSTMLEALLAVRVYPPTAQKIVNDLADRFDEAGVPITKK